MQAILPVALAARRLDLCHYTNFDAPLPGDTPSVVTMYDMSLLLSPHLHPARRVLMLTPLIHLTARRARAVVCLTESARQDAIRCLPLDPRRVHVVPGAVAPAFRPINDPEGLEKVRARYGLETDYVLFVGTIEPRKNLLRLAHAFAQLRHDGFTGQLVIAGGRGWKSAGLRPRIDELGIHEAVVFTGYVPDEDLVALLAGARAFVYPSLYEGFGLPIVEAFACGVPVVTSNRGAMAEVAADAALLVEPTDERALADALRVALTDEPVRRRLRAAGLARAAQFNRHNTARQALAVYKSVLGT